MNARTRARAEFAAAKSDGAHVPATGASCRTRCDVGTGDLRRPATVDDNAAGARTEISTALATLRLIQRWDPAAQPFVLALMERYLNVLATEIAGQLRDTSRVPAPGALARWRRALRAGVGSQHEDRPLTWRYDSLWTAACYEAAADECERQGLLTAADDCRLRAAEFLASTEKGGRAAA